MKFERPAYLINPDACKENIRTMAEKARRSGVGFRPHFKTHQSLAIGRWFREAGVTRITVSSLTSALYFSDDGWDDITIAFPVNLREMERINELASKVRIGLLLEDSSVATELDRQLKHPVDAYIKIDAGYHRTGLMLDEMPLICDLATVIRSSEHIRLKGLLTHAGQTYQAQSANEILEIYLATVSVLNRIRKNLGKGFEELIISYGDTPSCTVMDVFEGIDEIRPGNFIFYDLMQLHAGVCNLNQIGGIMVCPVVAIHPSRGQAVIYGGAIHFSKEFILIDGRRIYGQMVELDGQGWKRTIPGGYLISVSQEHGTLELPEAVLSGLSPGMIAGVIPVHSCLTANLMRGYQLPDGTAVDYLMEF